MWKGFVVAPRVGVTPEKLRGAAGRMGDLRDRVSSILSTLETSLAAKGAAWGGDGYGSTFTDGPNGNDGYTAAHTNLNTGLGDMATTLGSYAKGQYDAATLLEKQDDIGRYTFS